MSKIFFAAAACALLAGSALAGTVTVSGMTPTVNGERIIKRMVVKFDDLNPADSHGAAALYDRINQAALTLCRSNPGGTGSLVADKVEKCRAQAVKQAVKDVGSTELASLAAK